MKRTLIGTALVAAGLVFAAPAHADPDTAFANELHTYGIYGQRDYNAWIGKIACKRLRNNVDADANKGRLPLKDFGPWSEVKPVKQMSAWGRHGGVALQATAHNPVSP